jgi:hypothetical protein
MSNFIGFSEPNHTQTPNNFFDDLLKEIDDLSELKVTLVAIRQTFGWHRNSAELSCSFIEMMSGLSRNSVRRGIELALKRGTISIEKENTNRDGTIYRVLVQGVSREPPRGSAADPLEGQPLTPLNKGKKGNKLSETSKTEVSEGSPLIREAIASVKLDKGDRVTNYVKSPNPLPASIRNSIEHPKVPKTIEPTTPLSRYLMEQSKYGNYQWKGFASAGERDDWYRMEDTHDERDIREAINWACHQKRFGKNKLVHNIIMAVDNNKPARNTQQLIGRVANDEE